MDHLQRLKAERQGERFIPLSAIAQALQLTNTQKLHLDETLKEHAAQYWLENAIEPRDIRHAGGARVLERSLTGGGVTEPSYAQAFLTEMIVKGVLTTKKELREVPFLKLPQDEQRAIIDGFVSGNPLPESNAGLSATERLAVRAGITDEIIR